MVRLGGSEEWEEKGEDGEKEASLFCIRASNKQFVVLLLIFSRVSHEEEGGNTKGSHALNNR